MSTEATAHPNATRIERRIDAPAALIWQFWTTAAGLEQWFAPTGFDARVSRIEVTPGGELRYAMRATGMDQVAFLREIGSPLTVQLRKTFTDVDEPTRLAYLSLIDFVPDHEPYEHLTTVDIVPAGDRTTVVLTVDPMHEDTWTRQYHAHRGEELDKLVSAIAQRGAD
ncbi:SRPBCC family protein [Micromonospora humi]|uniref:Uncharacterized conserved protein YndB, AHSA1/START domain n=1 Tax=Micromonospora humi TaxID=745366 RepID=A0A1C5I4H7_9ACTN|nr:SRPBCC domain-containing protein [Micromonospora humi]SCG53174.1 Uncharacterized conserved protein YndB, AHSA1/START domain [Micromonospora humi]